MLVTGLLSTSKMLVTGLFQWSVLVIGVLIIMKLLCCFSKCHFMFWKTILLSELQKKKRRRDVLLNYENEGKILVQTGRAWRKTRWKTLPVICVWLLTVLLTVICQTRYSEIENLLMGYPLYMYVNLNFNTSNNA